MKQQHQQSQTKHEERHEIDLVLDPIRKCVQEYIMTNKIEMGLNQHDKTIERIIQHAHEHVNPNAPRRLIVACVKECLIEYMAKW